MVRGDDGGVIKKSRALTFGMFIVAFMCGVVPLMVEVRERHARIGRPPFPNSSLGSAH